MLKNRVVYLYVLITSLTAVFLYLEDRTSERSPANSGSFSSNSGSFSSNSGAFNGNSGAFNSNTGSFSSIESSESDPNYFPDGSPVFDPGLSQIPADASEPSANSAEPGGIPGSCWSGPKDRIELKSFCLNNLTFIANQVIPLHVEKSSKEIEKNYTVNGCEFSNKLTVKSGFIVGGSNIEGDDLSYTTIAATGTKDALSKKFIPYAAILEVAQKQCGGILLLNRAQRNKLALIDNKVTEITNEAPFANFNGLLKAEGRSGGQPQDSELKQETPTTR